MTPTPVGMRCPECARQKTRVTRGAVAAGRYDAPATYVLIALNVAAFLVEIATGSGGFSEGIGGRVVLDFGLFGPFVADGEWYRLLTYGFLHSSLIHIGFNMFALYFLGRLLEPAIGTQRFVAVYLASILGGALGALLLSPDSLTMGASGGVFGIFAATFLIARGRGIDALASNIGFVLLLNLAITLVVPRISIGGHLGGLAAGGLCALAILAGERGMLGRNGLPIEIAAMVAVGIVSIVAALGVA
jgi:membrane associated rhomboid family serine protease